MVARRDDAGGGLGLRHRYQAGGTITLHVAFGLPEDTGAFLWLLFAVVSWILTAGLVVGVTRASQEHPIS
jgi:hypothetical protein